MLCFNYCGYTCPADYKFIEATKANDATLKKEAYDIWHIKERYNVDFDPKTSFCFGCKVEESKIGVTTGNCTVRKWAIDKGHKAYIQCDELKTYKKDLWSRFPKFHKAIIEMQVNYRAKLKINIYKKGDSTNLRNKEMQVNPVQ